MYGDQTVQDILSYKNMRAVRLGELFEPLTVGEGRAMSKLGGYAVVYNSHKSTATWPVE